MPDDSLLDMALFHSNESKAMLQLFKQIENLIGVHHHHLSEGTYCEDILRSFLRQTLPKSLSVDTGFIIGSKTNIKNITGQDVVIESSPQIDILIHDSHNFAPIFRSGDFVVVLPDAVKGVIEVKKTLRSDNLQDALVVLAKVKTLLNTSNVKPMDRVFTGIYSFDVDARLQPLDGISDSFENRLKALSERVTPFYAIPSIIVAGEKYCLYSLTDHAWNIRVVVYDAIQETDGKLLNISGQLLIYCLTNTMRLHESQTTIKRIRLPEKTSVSDFEFSAPRSGE